MNWPTKKLGEICEIITGSTPRTSINEFYGGDILWAGPADLDQGDYVTETKKRLTQKGVEEGGARLIPKGSVMVSCIGNIGKIAIASKEMTTNQQINTFVPKYKCLDNKYLFYVINTKSSEFKKLSSRTTLPIVNKSKCATVEIPFPPIEIQKKIVAKIEELFSKIEEAKKLRAQAQQDTVDLLPATLHKIFEEGKKKRWEEKRLEGVAESVADGTHDTPKYQDEGLPLVTSKNLRPEGLNFDTAKFISEKDYEEINKRSKVSKGDILIGMIGTIGNVTRVETDKKFSIKNVGLIRPDESKVLSQYLVYYLDNSRLMSLITTGGTTQKFMALGILRRIKVSYPSLSEQKKIVEHLDSLSQKVKKIKELQKQTEEELKELEQSILNKAFKGELVS